MSNKFEFAQTKENEAALKKLREDFERMHQEAMRSFLKKDAAAVEHILRNYVTPPIKGEITQGKVRWRGIKEVVFQDNGGGVTFKGVRQRNTLITLDGQKIPMK